MKIIKVLGFALVIVLGALLFVYGEYDDSPGGQLLGLLIALFGVWRAFKLLRTKVR